jgi:hypothetical protein
MLKCVIYNMQTKRELREPVDPEVINIGEESFKISRRTCMAGTNCLEQQLALELSKELNNNPDTQRIRALILMLRTFLRCALFCQRLH